MKNDFSLWHFFKRHWLKIYFALSLLVVGFAYGLISAEYKMPPYATLMDARAAVIDWKKNWKAYTIVPQRLFLHASIHPGKGLTVNVPGKTWPGVTFFTGLVDKTVGMRLLDMEGKSLHQWKVSFNKIWPVAAHLGNQPNDLHQSINGAKLYENGDVVLNFFQKGIAKIDKCSNVVWKWPYRAHHSVYEDKDGNIWFPSAKKLKDPYLFSNQVRITLPEYIFKVSPEGKLLKEINLLETILRSDMIARLLATGKANMTVASTGNHYTHLNNVKILEGPKADAFPLFNAGDILVSIRNFNMLMVIDPDTHLVKWSMTGPFIRQHDPDFLDNGHISVFDNMGGTATGEALGASRILDIDPVTKKIRIVYEGSPGKRFISAEQGHHQYLPNGNILITESNAGRFFEITGSGEIVWSYIDRWDEKQVIVIYQAERYPEQYAKFTKEPCP